MFSRNLERFRDKRETAIMSLAVNRTSVSNLNLTTENVAENWMSASGRTRVDGS